jgi:Protein of unknown function (DUF4127)
VKIAFLPLDDRPITRDAFCTLALIAGAGVVTPPRALLGSLKIPGDVEALWAWVADEGAQADLLIGSAELLIYGGLVPSRIGHEPLDRCLHLASRWRRARAQRPDRSLMLSASNLRLPATADDTEEPEYWAVYGPEIFAASYHADRYEHTGDPASRDAAEAARAAVPASVLADVHARRARNLAVLLSLVDLAADGVLDALLIGQDDAAEWGLTRRDLHSVEAAIRERRASDRAWVTYGTDELGARLLARAVVNAEERTPGVRVIYSVPENRMAIPRYEGQALDLTVGSHIATAGCRRVEADPDVALFVHNFPGTQEEAPHQRSYDAVELRPFIGALEAAAARGVPCGLADVRYSNGADRTLVDVLLDAPDARGLRAYGGWNTMSNTLGMVLTQTLLPSGAAARAFLIQRFLDDWAYQAVIRQRLAGEILPLYPGVGSQKIGQAQGACASAARRWLEQEFIPPLERCFRCRIIIDRVSFPWERLFNIELGITVT